MRSALLLLFMTALAWAQTPTLEQTLRLKTGSSPRISPDGRLVAYVVTEADWDDNSFATQIWMAATAGADRYQLTHSKKSSREPRWAPDSRHLAFLSDRDGSSQIYVIAAAGGEAAQLTRIEGGVESLEWSPDGRRIAFTAAGPEPKAKRDRRDKYGDFRVVGADFTRLQLWSIRADDDKAKPEMLAAGDDSGEFSVGGFQWSPDSRRIAFSASRDPGLAGAAGADIYTVWVFGKAVRKIVGAPGPDVNPVWSPDGAEIAYETANGRDAYFYLNRHIAIVPAAGGSPRIIGTAFDENPHIVAWVPEGIYFEAAQKTSAHLFRLDPRTGAIERVSASANLQVGGSTFTDAGTETAFTCAEPNRYSEICVSAVGSFAPRALTNLGDQIKIWKLATREVFEWASQDGTPIEGILIKPAGFDPAKKYPLLVVIHGGPVATDRPSLTPDRNYPVEMFAAKGAVILRPNYRGSAGYGEKFRSASVRNLGVGDTQDVLSGVDALVARGFIDGERVGAMGWSEGGFVSAFLGASTRRFKAVSVGAGISDWSTYYVNSDLAPFTREYLEATPWQDPEIYRKLSPITYIGGAKTPTLIQHGDQDPRVPIPNAYELYQALKDHGVPVKMIVYPGLGHTINKPKQQLAVMEQNFQWFSEWIWGDKP